MLVRLRDGEPGALEELLPALYGELRQIVYNRLRGERPDHALRTTELVHEAYLKPVDHPQKKKAEKRGDRTRRCHSTTCRFPTRKTRPS